MFKCLGSGVSGLDVKPTLLLASFLLWPNDLLFLSSVSSFVKPHCKEVLGEQVVLGGGGAGGGAGSSTW